MAPASAAPSGTAHKRRHRRRDCGRRVIARERSNLWVPLVQQGTNHMGQNHHDSAIASFRKANLIFRDDPAAYINMASAFLALDQTDSAIAYFRRASVAGTGLVTSAEYSIENGNSPPATGVITSLISMKRLLLAGTGWLKTIRARVGSPASCWV